MTSRGGFIGGATTGGLRHVARRSADGGVLRVGRGLRDRGWPEPPSAARRVASGAGGRIGPIAEPTYEVQALAIKLTQNLRKRVAAGDADLSEEEAFIVTVVELYDRLGTADEGTLSRQQLRDPP